MSILLVISQMYFSYKQGMSYAKLILFWKLVLASNFVQWLLLLLSTFVIFFGRFLFLSWRSLFYRAPPFIFSFCRRDYFIKNMNKFLMHLVSTDKRLLIGASWTFLRSKNISYLLMIRMRARWLTVHRELCKRYLIECTSNLTFVVVKNSLQCIIM
jgi:hypothetical protein